VLVGSRVRLTGEVEELLGTHWLVTGPRGDPGTWPSDWQVITSRHTERQTTLLVRTASPVLDSPWSVAQVDKEDLVLAYLRPEADAAPSPAPTFPLYSILFYGGIVILYLVPALIGIFWGAPLVTHELETGTFRLAWSQSVTRARWLAVKLALIGATAIVTCGLLSLMITWWASPIDHSLGLGGSLNRLTPLVFGARGIVPVGYAAFAFALGVTAGVLIGRTVPDMAATLAVFTGALVAMSLWIAPHLIPPRTATSAFNPFGGYGSAPSAERLHEADASGEQAPCVGHVQPGRQRQRPRVHRAGPAGVPIGSTQACEAGPGGLHLRQLVTYQPASRFWEFQWYETAIFLALALVLAWVCFWLIRRRIS
jgi:hypothetical protein